MKNNRVLLATLRVLQTCLNEANAATKDVVPVKEAEQDYTQSTECDMVATYIAKLQGEI